MEIQKAFVLVLLHARLLARLKRRIALRVATMENDEDLNSLGVGKPVRVDLLGCKATREKNNKMNKRGSLIDAAF